jgi:hypothetical protein
MTGSPDLPRQSLDLAFRTLWQRRPDALAALAIGPSFRAAQPEPPALLVAERAPDGVATVYTDDGPCVLHLEFETRVKPAALPRRMAHAGWLLHGPRDGLPVRSVVVLLDAQPGLPTTYAMTHADDVVGTYHFRVLALSALDADALLDAPELQAGLWALVPLARGATTEHVARAAQRLRDLGSPDAPDLAVVSLLLGARKFGYDELVGIFHREFLMLGDGWAGIEQEGIKKGLERGLAQGLERGRHEASRAALRTVCTARFGVSLDALLEQVPDTALTDAIAAVATATDVDSARAALAGLQGP